MSSGSQSFVGAPLIGYVNGDARSEISDSGETDPLTSSGLRNDRAVRSHQHVLAALLRSSHKGIPRDSLYGSAVVLPQVARTAKWNPVFVGKVVKAFSLLLMCNVVQIMFVYEVGKLVKEQTSKCNGNEEFCIDEGYVRFDHGGLFKHWYLCHNDIHQLRLLCMFAFVVHMFHDARQSFEMLVLFMSLPTSEGPWLRVSQTHEITADGGDLQAKRTTDLQLGYQVDGMPAFWKAFNTVVWLAPKILIWIFLFLFGGVWLMNTPERKELILNAVALVFVSQMDELLFASVANVETQQRMEEIQPWMPPYEHHKGGDDSSEDDLDILVHASRFRRWCLICIDMIVNPLILSVLMISAVELYNSACHW